ncbi:MAG: uracil-DNA glycosylase [Candidatus Omnitrophica bacterium]|nr:uracil-DNA glycosylase [Candidatus Omnitrophota bacterium]
MTTPRSASDASALLNRLKLEEWSGISWMTHSKTPAPPATQQRTLKDWEAAAKQCTLCNLCKKRRTAVFGEGNPKAEIMFVGEGPGAEEDMQGRPFVGPAGALLTKIIQALGLSREEVYIANTVKCRPPNNRVPAPEELAACRPYLEAQIELIRPKAICALGRTAANALLKTDAPIISLRGKTHRLGGTPLIVTYHPAFLLRNPESKRDTWNDVQKLLPLIGRPAVR